MVEAMTLRALLLVLLLGAADRGAAQDVGPVISEVRVDGRFATRGEKVVLVGTGFEAGKGDQERTVTVDGHPAKIVAATGTEVTFVVPHEVLPGPVRVHLAIARRGVSESSFMVRVAGDGTLEGLGGCVTMYSVTWTSDAGVPEDPQDPVLAEAVAAAFRITRFERVAGTSHFVAEGTCEGVPDGWPLVLELRRERVLTGTVAVEARDGRWRSLVGPYSGAGTYGLNAAFEVGLLHLPEARDFRFDVPAARQGLYDHVYRDASLKLP